MNTIRRSVTSFDHGCGGLSECVGLARRLEVRYGLRFVLSDCLGNCTTGVIGTVREKA